MNIENNKCKLGGIFTFEQYRDGKLYDAWEDHNIVTDESLTYALNAAYSNGTILPTWYLGVFKNNYTPLSTSVASTFAGAGVANEATTEYTEATRPVWNDGAGAAAKVISNSASPAVFTFNTGVTIYGALLISGNVKGGLTGTLGAASKFAASRVMIAADVLNVTYTLTASST